MRLTPKRDGQLTEVGKPQAITYAESPKPLLSADKVKLQKELNPGGFTNKEVEFIKKAKGNGFTIEQTKAFIDKKRTQEQVGKEGIEKMQQPVKDILGGTAAGFASLGPNLAGGAMKLLGKDAGVGPFGGYMASKGIPVVPNGLEKAGQTMLDRGTEMENITTDAMGARPDAIGTQIGKQVAPIAATFAGGGAFGTTKLGSAGFKQVGQGLKQFNPMQIAQGLGKAAVAGAGEGLMYDAAESGGQNLGEMAGYGALGNAAIASLPIVGKAASKALGAIGNTAIGQPLKNASNKLYLSGLLNPKKLEYVANTLRQTGDDVDNVTEWMQQRAIKGTKTGIVDQLDNAATGTRGKVVETVGQLKGNIQDQSVKGAIESLVDAIGDPKSKLKQSKLAELQALLVKHDTTGLSWAEVQKVKEEMDDILDLFTVAGDVKAGQQKADLGAIRQELRTMLEKTAMDQLGVDIKMLNRDTAVAKALSKYIKYKDKTDAVREFLSPFASPFLGGAAGFTQGDTLETRIRNAVVGAMLGKVAGSTQIKTNTAFYLRKASNFFSKLTPAEKGFLSTVTKKLDDIEITPNSTVGGSGLPSASKSMLDSAIDSVPNAKGLMESIGQKLDDTIGLSDDTMDVGIGKGLKKKVDPNFAKGIKPKPTTPIPKEVKDTGLKPVSKSTKALPVKKEGDFGRQTIKGGVVGVKPNNQLKFNQGEYYEPVRLVVNDKDAQVARYGALRNKEKNAAMGKGSKLTDGEKREIEQIPKRLGLTDKEALDRHSYLKEQAKKARSKTEQVVIDINDNFWSKPSLGTDTSKGLKYKTDPEFSKGLKPRTETTNNPAQVRGLPKQTNVPTSVSKELAPLYKMAEKYKSVEGFSNELYRFDSLADGAKFVRAGNLEQFPRLQGEGFITVYRGSKGKGITAGDWVTDSLEGAKRYGPVSELKVAKSDIVNPGIESGEFIYAPKKLQTTKKQIREEANPSKGLPKAENSLITEAKKYKSADEFEKRFRDETYNANNVDTKISDKAKEFNRKYVPLLEDGTTKKYKENIQSIIEDTTLDTDSMLEKIKPIKEKLYNYQKSQLRKIREEANPSKGLPKTENSLITEARKYKSADEFKKVLQKQGKVIGEGNSGKVYEMGGSIYKNDAGNEGKILEIMKGSDNVINGEKVSGKVKLQKAKRVLSIDDIKDEFNRYSMGETYIDNNAFGKLNRGVSEITNNLIHYGDQMQVGVFDDGLKLLDFSIARKTTDNSFSYNNLYDNLDALGKRYSDFGVSGYKNILNDGKSISRMFNSFTKKGSIDDIMKGDYAEQLGKQGYEAVEKAFKEGFNGDYIYYARDARPVMIEGTYKIPTKNRSMLLSKSKLPDSQIKQWELQPIIEIERKSESQLRKIREEANPSKGLPKTENSLITEAKKYKSADEFFDALSELPQSTQGSFPSYKYEITKPSENVLDVLSANYYGGEVSAINRKLVSIDDLSIVDSLENQEGRISKLSEEIKNSGKVSPIIADSDGNVIEGRHRVQAMKQLGESEIPAIVFEKVPDSINTKDSVKKIREEANK